MPGRGFPADGRPTPEQELLLETATAAREVAVAAWRSWKERCELDHSDFGTLRLLPLVYRRLCELGIDDPDLGRLKGVYRRAWYRNQIVFRQAADALRILRAAGLETMLLKGAALSILYYRDLGVRPMDDVDILVRTGDARAALDVLAGAGWTTATAVSPKVFLGVRHAEQLVGPDDANVDLHWNALWQPGRDDDFWEAAVQTGIAGEPTRALCPSDEVLHACVHGDAWNPVAPVRWAADTLTVLRTAESAIDWDRLVVQARARRVTAALAGALGYLSERFRAPVPPSALEELRTTPTRRHERLGYRAALASPSPLRTLFIVWDRYRRLSDLDTPFSPPRSFVDYARQTWDFERPWQLPAHAARRLVRHALGRPGASRTALDRPASRQRERPAEQS